MHGSKANLRDGYRCAGARLLECCALGAMRLQQDLFSRDGGWLAKEYITY